MEKYPTAHISKGPAKASALLFVIVSAVAALSFFSCSSGNADAPRAGNTHPPKYVLVHGAKATADLSSCQVCHGLDFKGTGNPVPSCFSCHQSGPPFSIHSIPYTGSAAHGSAAKADLLSCRQCHGDPPNNFDGGVVADSALFNAPAGTCSACHPAAKAHPTNWQGSNEDTDLSYASSHRDISEKAVNESCALCHKTNGPGSSPSAGAPSCYNANFTNADGYTSGCHAGGFNVAPHNIPYSAEASHGPAAKNDLAYCQQCHGASGTIQFNGGVAATACSTAACHPAAGAHPTRWEGTNDITPAYVSSHRKAGNQNATCLICHDFTQGRIAPDPQAPSCFTAGFTNADGATTGCHAAGPGAPHALPFAASNLHGPEAQKDLTYCQQCHATPFNGGPGSNPRFNVAISNLANGCEDCHSPRTAHPFPFWMGAAANSHKTAGNLTNACTLCHGPNLQGGAEGGVGRACQSCHEAGSPLVALNCTSCHNNPPDSAGPAGNQRPNRAGAHGLHNALAKITGQCLACHNGSGTNTSVHYDTSAPAAVAMLPAYQAKTGAFSYNAGGASCSGVSCHGGQATVNWTSGSINVNTDCTACHSSGTTQYNGYTGRHTSQSGHRNVSCTYCMIQPSWPQVILRASIRPSSNNLRVRPLLTHSGITRQPVGGVPRWHAIQATVPNPGK